MVHIYLHPKRRTKKDYSCSKKEGQKRAKARVKNERKRQEMKVNEGKKNKTSILMHALRAQAESRGDKVAVCWYDQSHDMS